MKQLQDAGLLTQYQHKYRFDTIFHSIPQNVRLYEYEKGEIIHCQRGSASYIQFIVSGSIQIYAIRENGSHYPICHKEEFTVLGDMEFCGENALHFFVEVTKKVHCIEVPLSGNLDALQNDAAFLRFLLHSIARKMALFSVSASSFSNLEERLLYYMEAECPDHRFKGVDTTANHLRCSRRQLQRVLIDLLNQNKIKKLGKGDYQLI